ncbi:MAG: gfo/Idh/MocA family oxidoreductase, partial [Bacteroidales bacterium]
YCEKPLTHTVYETRLLTRLAAQHNVATQMGNQGASGEGVRQTCEAIWSGMIGEVTRVEAFTDRPIWPQGLETPTAVHTPHPELDWDLFIGPAKYRPYNEIYHPWNWRGWWDFGTGALGDMACHILQPVVKALNLKSPVAVQGSSTALMTDCAPNAQIAKFIFPARDNMPKVAMPRVEVTWYDGGLLPEYPQGWPAGRNMNDSGGAVIFHGTKDTLVCGCYGANPWLLSGREIPVPTLTREVPENNHYTDFIRACKESPESRVKTASDFSEAGPLNEMVVMGVLAVRLQGLNRELTWNGDAMQFTNISPTDTIRMKTKDGFSIKDGHPTFNHQYTDPINALEFANELIRHTYREGYSLPEMP